MALTWFLLASLASIVIGDDLLPTNNSSSVKTTPDTKRRSDVVDEAFLEQKDILLEMLESKLKEVRDKKKKKLDKAENNTEGGKCDLPSNVDLRLKSNGLSALGETDLLMKFGSNGKGTLNLDASGISNVGKARLDLAIGDGTFNVPGLNNLFVGKPYSTNCDKQNETEPAGREKVPQILGNELLDYRRTPNDNSTNNDEANKGVNSDNQNKTGTNNIGTNTTLGGNDTIKAVDDLSTTVAVENNTVDLGNSTTKP